MVPDPHKRRTLPEPGDVIAGRYRIDELLGEGGMGAVFRATQLGLLRAVAVKVILPERDNARTHERFEREARVAAAMRHDGLVDVYDFGVDSNGSLYLVMELLLGTSLTSFVRSRGDRISVDMACAIIADVAAALAAAHGAGLVHRDIKPDNIFCCEDDPSRADLAGEVPAAEPRPAPRVKIVDFGLAFIKDGGQLGRLTSDTVISGTPPFMAPEQCRGGVEVTSAVDVYALGCVLVDILTGAPPFDGQQGDLIAQHLHVPAPRLATRMPQVPAALSHLVERMLDKKPAERPTAAEVETTLRDILRGDHVPHDRSSRAIAPGVGTSLVTQQASLVTADIEPTRPLIVLRDGSDPDLATSLAVNGFDVVVEARVDDAAGHGVELLLLHTPADIARRARAGAVIIAAADPEDLDRVSALVHAGAAEVTMWPLEIPDLCAKIVRASKRVVG